MSRQRRHSDDALFQPDAILPSQFFASLRRDAPRKAGEWQLMRAVLEDAVQAFKKYLGAKDRQGQRLFREAEAWLLEAGEPADVVPASDDSSAALSFEYVCDVLGLDADSVRAGLQRWRAQHAPGHPPAQKPACRAA